MEVTIIPTNRPTRRDLSDMVFKTEEAKWRAENAPKCMKRGDRYLLEPLVSKNQNISAPVNQRDSLQPAQRQPENVGRSEIIAQAGRKVR